MEKVIQITDSTAIKLTQSIEKLNSTLQQINKFNKEPKFLSAKDISKILGMNLNSATNLMKTDGFPSVKVGRLKVEEQAFWEWCRQNKKRID